MFPSYSGEIDMKRVLSNVLNGGGHDGKGR